MDLLNKDSDVSEDKSNDAEVQTPEISTGYDKLDDMIRDLGKAKVCIIAGRPALGKTALAVSIAKNVAIDQRIPTLFFSLEMSTPQLTRRIVSNLCELETEKIRTNTCDEREHEIYEEGMKRIKNSPLMIDDSPSLSMLELALKVRRMVIKHGIRLVIVDFLQLMERAGPAFYNDELTIIVHSMKELASELNITFIICAQLPSRAKGERKRPGLSTIKKYYVNIEKEADIIICIHRSEYFQIMKFAPEKGLGIAEIIVAQNAFGENKSCRLFFRPLFSRFYNQQ